MEGDSPNASENVPACKREKVHCGPVNSHLLSVFFFPLEENLTTTQMLFETERNVHC